MSAVCGAAPNGFGDPGGVAGKQLVIGGCAEKADHSQLHNKMVYKFLNLFLGINAVFQVPLGVDVQEGGGAAQGHGGAVLLLNRR